MSCTNNTSNINKTFIIESASALTTGDTISACTAVYTNNIIECDPESGVTINNILQYSGDTIMPLVDNTINLGTPLKRFRDLNTISGTSTVWVSTNRIETPELRLGLDLSGNTRTITADSSILKYDTLLGGSY